MTANPLVGRMISGVLWLAGARAFGQIIAWLATLFVVRLLSPADYGLMGMAVLVTSFLMLFNELGLGAAIVQRAELTDVQLRDLRAVIVVINVALYVGAVLCTPAVAVYFGEPALNRVLPTLGLGFIISGFGASSSYLLQRQMLFKAKATSELIGGLCGSATTLALAWTGQGVWSLVVGYLVQQVVTNGLYSVHAWIPFRVRFSRRNVSPFLGFGAKVALARVLWYISSNADFAVVGRVLGTIQLGFYGLAFQFSSLPIEKVVTIVSQVAFPSFSKLQHDSETLQRYYLKLLSIVALITFPMFIGLYLLADIAIPLFFTSKWQPVVVPLKLLCLVSCLRAVETLNGPLLLALGSSRLVLFNNFLQAVVMPVGFYLGALYGGLWGVSVSWLMTWPVLYAIVTWQTLRLVGLSVAAYVSALHHAIAGSVTMAMAVVVLRLALPVGLEPLYTVIVLTLAGGVAYVGYLVLFNRDAVRSARMILGRSPQSVG